MVSWRDLPRPDQEDRVAGYDRREQYVSLLVIIAWSSRPINDFFAKSIQTKFESTVRPGTTYTAYSHRCGPRMKVVFFRVCYSDTIAMGYVKVCQCFAPHCRKFDWDHCPYFGVNQNPVTNKIKTATMHRSSQQADTKSLLQCRQK